MKGLVPGRRFVAPINGVILTVRLDGVDFDRKVLKFTFPGVAWPALVDVDAGDILGFTVVEHNIGAALVDWMLRDGRKMQRESWDSWRRYIVASHRGIRDDRGEWWSPSLGDLSAMDWREWVEPTEAETNAFLSLAGGRR